MIYSSGINKIVMHKHNVNMKYFKGILIELVTTTLKDKHKDKIKCLIEDIIEVPIHEKYIEIKFNQTFSLENESTEKTLVFHITLFGTNPKKDEEQEQE